MKERERGRNNEGTGERKRNQKGEEAGREKERRERYCYITTKKPNENQSGEANKRSMLTSHIAKQKKAGKGKQNVNTERKKKKVHFKSINYKFHTLFFIC